MIGIAIAILIDAVALYLIVSLLARQNMANDMGRFIMLAITVLVGSFILGLVAYYLELSSFPFLPAYFALVMLSMRFILGVTWTGAALASAIFIIYKLLLGLVC